MGQDKTWVDDRKGFRTMKARMFPWALAVAFALCAAWLVHRAWSVELEAERAAEARQLETEGQIVALQKTRDALNHDLDVSLEENSKLSDALDDARKAAPDTKTTRVVRASTGPIPIDPETMRAFCESLKPKDETTSVVNETAAPPGETIEGEVRVAEVDVRTDKGNTIVAGAAACYRVKPLPELKLFDAKFDTKATHVSVLDTVPPPPDDRWPWYAHEAIGLGVGLAAGVVLTR